MSNSKIKLDLKAFKHVKSDDKSTTLQHKLGHQITLVHNAMSPESKAQLQALSHVAKDAQTDSQSDELKHKMAEGGKVAKYCAYCGGMAHGGECEDVEHYAEGGDTGGKAPVPPGEGGTKGNNMKQTLHDYGSAAQQPAKIPSASDAWDRIKHAWADGGKVEEKPPMKKPEEPEGGTLDYREIKKEAKKMRHEEGNKPKLPNRKKYADPTEEVSADDNAPTEDPMDESAALRASAAKDIAASPIGQGYEWLKNHLPPVDVAAGMGHNEAPETPPAEQPPALNKAALETEAAGPQDGQRQPAQGAPSPQAAAPAPQGQPAGLAPQQPQATAPQTPANPLQQAQQGLNEARAGMYGKAAAENQLGTQQAAVSDQAAKTQQELLSRYQSQVQDLNNERSALQKDIQNGMVDPNKYWDNHSKVASIIGVVLSGFNPTNSPNGAAELIKQQMDRDLDAQKANLGAKHNLLRANLDHYKDLESAMMATRIAQNDMVTHQLNSNAAKMSGQFAKAAAQRESGILSVDSAQKVQELAQRQIFLDMMRQSGSNAGQNPNSPEAVEHTINVMRYVNPEMAKDMQSRYVPGVGLAKVPVPEGVRTEIVAHKKLDDATKDLLDFTKTHTTLNPYSPDYKIGAQKAEILQQMVREGMLGTVFRESEKPLLKKMVDENPAGAFKMISTNPKLRTLLQSSEMQVNALKQTYGLPTTHSNAEGPTIERRDPKSGKTIIYDATTKKPLRWK